LTYLLHEKTKILFPFKENSGQCRLPPKRARASDKEATTTALQSREISATSALFGDDIGPWAPSKKDGAANPSVSAS